MTFITKLNGTCGTSHTTTTSARTHTTKSKKYNLIESRIGSPFTADGLRLQYSAVTLKSLLVHRDCRFYSVAETSLLCGQPANETTHNRFEYSPNNGSHRMADE
jgi:hypothetical protein